MDKSKEFVKNKTQGQIIEQTIKEVLKGLDMKKDLRGFQLWIEAVRYIIAEKTKENFYSMKSVYNELSIKHEITSSQVERVLRTARESISVDIQSYFSTKHTITNSLFLALLCEEVEKRAKI